MIAHVFFTHFITDAIFLLIFDAFHHIFTFVVLALLPAAGGIPEEPPPIVCTPGRWSKPNPMVPLYITHECNEEPTIEFYEGAQIFVREAQYTYPTSFHILYSLTFLTYSIFPSELHYMESQLPSNGSA